MRRRSQLFAILLGLWVGHALLDAPQLWAQRSKLGLSPTDQQKYDDLMRSARQNEIIGYVAAGLGILFVVVAVPVLIYRDRKKKARGRAHKADDHSNERRDSSPKR